MDIGWQRLAGERPPEVDLRSRLAKRHAHLSKVGMDHVFHHQNPHVVSAYLPFQPD
jgi:hypothetical protein